MAVVHRVYARALYDAAKERQSVEPVQEELNDFVAAVRDVPELRAVLRNPQIDPRAKAAALEAVTGGGHDIVRNFLLLLTEKGRAGELADIAKEFERLMAREERRLTVELTTARELTDAEADGILKQIEDAAGRKVEATRSVDPDLIGGIVLQAGSFRLDASVRGRLNRLRQDLATRPVRRAGSPSLTCSHSPKSAAPTSSSSRLNARPVTPCSSSSISSEPAFSSP